MNQSPPQTPNQFHPFRWAVIVVVIVILSLLAGRTNAQSVIEPATPTVATQSSTKNVSLWSTSFQDSVRKASQNDRPIMLYFTGAPDWCPWCKRIEDEIFTKHAFKMWSTDRVVLVRIEFPQTGKLPPELAEQNKRLIRRYQSYIRGYPTILFLTPRQQVVGKMGYRPDGALEWIHEAQKLVSKRDKVTRLPATGSPQQASVR